MAQAAKNYKIINMICLFIVSIEKPARYNVMNVGFNVVFFVMLVTVLACVVISFSGFSGLRPPILPSKVNLPTFEVYVSFPAFINGHLLVFAFFRAIVTISESFLRFASFIFVSTPLATQRNFFPMLPGFRQARGVFGTALTGTKSTFSISPFIKVFMTPFAGIRGSLTAILFSISVSARHRTIFNSAIKGFFCKRLFTMLASVHYYFSDFINSKLEKVGAPLGEWHLSVVDRTTQAHVYYIIVPTTDPATEGGIPDV